jgi:hypothetical protein
MVAPSAIRQQPQEDAQHRDGSGPRPCRDSVGVQKRSRRPSGRLAALATRQTVFQLVAFLPSSAFRRSLLRIGIPVLASPVRVMLLVLGITVGFERPVRGNRLLHLYFRSRQIVQQGGCPRPDVPLAVALSVRRAVRLILQFLRRPLDKTSTREAVDASDPVSG